MVEELIEFDSYMNRYKHDFTLNTIEFEGAIIDKKDKFIMLLELIREYALSNIATDLHIKDFLKEMLNTKMIYNNKTEFLFDMTRIQSSLQDTKHLDRN